MRVIKIFILIATHLIFFSLCENDNNLKMILGGGGVDLLPAFKTVCAALFSFFNKNSGSVRKRKLGSDTVIKGIRLFYS